MKTRIVTASVLAICLFASSASGTLIQRFEIEDLARRSQSIAIVRAKASRAAWEGGMIRTRIILDVTRTMAGVEAEDFAVVVPGGSVDGITASIGGMPEFQAGDEYVVFLEKRSAGGMHVVGGFQGAFRLAIEPETKMIVARRNRANDAALVAANGTFDSSGGETVLYLDELEARVRAVRR